MQIVSKPITKTKGQCEVCDTPDVDVAVYYGNIAQCDSCYSKELELLATTRANSTIIQAQKIDQTVEVKSDIFNKATVSIIELKGAIDNDSNIQNKQYALAEVVVNRISKFNDVIFAKQAELAELTSARRAHVTYLNDLAMSLRIEEREKLKIRDISYIPSSPKVATIKKSATTKTAKSIKSAEIRALATELHVPDSLHLGYITAVQMLVTKNGWELRKAAEHMATQMMGRS